MPGAAVVLGFSGRFTFEKIALYYHPNHYVIRRTHALLWQDESVPVFPSNVFHNIGEHYPHEAHTSRCFLPQPAIDPCTAKIVVPAMKIVMNHPNVPQSGMVKSSAIDRIVLLKMKWRNTRRTDQQAAICIRNELGSQSISSPNNKRVQTSTETIQYCPETIREGAVARYASG